MKRNFILSVLISLAVLVSAQADSTERKATVTFSDPGKPGRVEVHLMAGDITVEGYPGSEVMITARSRGQALKKAKTEDGMYVIQNYQVGLDIEEENNIIEISTGVHQQPVSITLRVPRKTSLVLRTLHQGVIQVKNVEGELDLNNLNGPIEARGITGTVIAHSLNGKITVVFNGVDPKKPMSFSTLNGDVDVTFPPDINFTLKLDSRMGKIFSDFDLKLEPGEIKTEEDQREEGGRYEISWQKSLVARINKGGPEILFKTLQGNIYIRSGK